MAEPLPSTDKVLGTRARIKGEVPMACYLIFTLSDLTVVNPCTVWVSVISKKKNHRGIGVLLPTFLLPSSFSSSLHVFSKFSTNIELCNQMKGRCILNKSYLSSNY